MRAQRLNGAIGLGTMISALGAMLRAGHGPHTIRSFMHLKYTQTRPDQSGFHVSGPLLHKGKFWTIRFVEWKDGSSLAVGGQGEQIVRQMVW